MTFIFKLLHSLKNNIIIYTQKDFFQFQAQVLKKEALLEQTLIQILR